MLTYSEKQEIAQAIRTHGALRPARRALAGKVGASPDGPSIKTMRVIHREMCPDVVLSNRGGRPSTYTQAQRLEIGRLMSVWQLESVLTILAHPDNQHHNKRILPGAVHITPPTLYTYLEEFKNHSRSRRRA